MIERVQGPNGPEYTPPQSGEAKNVGPASFVPQAVSSMPLKKGPDISRIAVIALANMARKKGLK